VLAATAYGAYRHQTQLDSFYHSVLLVGWHRLGDPALPFLSWTLFAMLALAMIFLIFQAWQEQGLVETFTIQLERERDLLQEKNNFASLSSHYLRTPLALVTNGIELLVSSKPDPALLGRLNQLSAQLKAGVETLLAETSQPAEPINLKPPRGYWAYLLGASAGAFLSIGMAVYILANLAFYNRQLKSITALAAVLVLAVIVYSASRGHSARRLLKEHYGKLMAEQRTLDANRNYLIEKGLKNLKTPLDQLHAELVTLNRPDITRPVAEGLSRFEIILQKFVILMGLWAGSMTAIRQPVNLNQLLSKVEQHNKVLLQQSGLSLDSQLRAANVLSDPLLLEYVIDSLVNNAVKYGSGGQPIVVKSQKGRRNTIEISIIDRGPGISEQKKALIFKPFSRAENAATDFEKEGLGLSLYLDKLIMRYLGGAIKAEPTAGGGATFKLIVAN
jgi:signal transduction histidine kinase